MITVEYVPACWLCGADKRNLMRPVEAAGTVFHMSVVGPPAGRKVAMDASQS